MRFQRFALAVSVLGGIGFVVSTCLPIIVDPLISDILHRTIDYTNPIGPYITLFALPIAIGIYLVNAEDRFRQYSVPLTAMIMAAATFLSLLNFPGKAGINMFVMGSGLAYAFMLSLTVASYHHRPILATDNRKVDTDARIERIRLEYETWFRGILALTAFVAVPAGIIVFNAYKQGLDMYALSGVITSEAVTASLMYANVIYLAAFYFGILITAFLLVAFKKIEDLVDQLNKIESRKAVS